MRKAWQALARPFEAVIVWVACHGLGHPAALHVDLVFRCRRCSRVLGQLLEPSSSR